VNNQQDPLFIHKAEEISRPYPQNKRSYPQVVSRELTYLADGHATGNFENIRG